MRRVKYTGWRALILGGTALALAATASAVTLAERGSGPPSTEINPSALQRVVDHRTAAASADVWTATTPDGRTCVFFPAAAAGKELSAADAQHATAFCPTTSVDESAASSPRYVTFTNWVPTQGGSYVPVVQGSLGGGGVESISADSGAGPLTIDTADGYFVLELPAVAARGQLPPGGPFYLVGTDSSGAEVFRLNLNDTLQKGTPPATPK